MTHADLVDAIASQAGLSLTKAMQAVEVALSVTSDALKRGEDVKLQNFGTFQVVDRAARPGRNPATGEEIHIPASKAVKFKPSKSLKESVAKEV